jgi:Domain of unknown function (DUF4157)
MNRTADKVSERSPAQANSSVQPAKADLPSHPLLALQRSIGNRAVGRIVGALSGAPIGESRSMFLQRKCACGSGGMSAECKDCSGKKPLRLQTKLTVNEPGDSYEQEADRMADQVLATPMHSVISGPPPHIQRSSGQPAGQMDAAPASVDHALASHGEPLEPALRQEMEQRFGHDFSGVRVHSGGAAEESARDVNSHAYTVGNNIVFGAGTYAPGSERGRRLLAHELTHVVQQSKTVSLQRDNKDEDFIIDQKAMDHLESLLSRLYDALPRDERIKLKADGTVAIGLVTRRGGNLNQPVYVFTTNNNVASTEFKKAAESLGLRQYWGDAGVVEERQGPPRPHSPAGGPPAGKGGIEHAEQLMIGHADDHGYVVHGMAVSRRFCHDCPIVIQGHKGGRIMVSVIPDPDKNLPNPRDPGSRPDKPAKKPAEPPAAKKPEEPPAPKKPAEPPAAKKPAEPPAAKKPEEPPAPKKPAEPPAAKKPAEPPAAKKPEEPPAPKKPAEPPAAKKPAEPPAPKKPKAPPAPKKPAEPPAPKKPGKAPSDIGPTSQSGTSGGKAVSTAASGAQRTYAHLVGQVTGKLMQIASKDPEAADAIADINNLMDAHAFVQNPKQFTAQSITDFMIDGAFGKLARQLAAHEEHFFSTYPDVGSFHGQALVHGMSLDDLDKRYDQATRNLRLPSVRKALATAFMTFDVTDKTPKTEINRRLRMINEYLAKQPEIGKYVKEYEDAKQKYAFGLVMVRMQMDNLRQQLGELPADFADDIRRRGDALFKAASILDDYYHQVLLLSALPGADMAVYMFMKLRDGFSGLGNDLHLFASRAGHRQREYEQEIPRLEARADQLNSVRGAFDVIYPQLSP